MSSTNYNVSPPPPPHPHQKKKIDSTSKSLHAHIASWDLQVHVTTKYNVHQSNKQGIFGSGKCINYRKKSKKFNFTANS